MNQKTYLEQLGNALSETYPQKEAKDVLSDYADFFTSGLAEGKNEEELCKEFGPPEKVVRQLKSSGENESEEKGISRLNTLCTVLGIVILLIYLAATGVFQVFLLDGSVLTLAAIPGLQSTAEALWAGTVPQAFFWLSLLFPLALEGVLALRLTRGASQRSSFRRMPLLQAIFLLPSAAMLAWFVSYAQEAFQIFQSHGNLEQELVSKAMFTTWGSRICILLLIASGAFFLISAVRGCRKSRWFLFLDTFLLSGFAVLSALLSYVPGDSIQNPAAVIFWSFLWAILPNLSALVIFWAVLKIQKQRREKAWKAR